MPSLYLTNLGKPIIELNQLDKMSIESHVGPENSDLCQLFIKSYVGLLFDSPVSGKPLSRIKQFLRELVDADLRDLVIRYSTLADCLLRSCVMTSEATITGDFLEEMRDTPIFFEYVRFYKTGDPVVLTFILTFLMFGKKLDYEDPQFEPAAFRDWLQIEQDLEDLTFSEDLTFWLRKILQQLVGPLKTDVTLFKFGPGYVAEGYIDPNEKLEHLSIPVKLQYTFRDKLSTLQWRATTEVNNHHYMDGRFCEEKQLGRLRIVKKNMKVARTIIMEPNAYMLHQQEVSRWCVEMMHRSLIGKFVNLRDQTINQQYALDGSCNFNVDTLDLAAASDRVSLDLVKAIFPPGILYYLMGTRSDGVLLPDGSTRVVKKFAPMGSALCFPVQCMVFTSITILGYLMHYYGVDTLSDLSKDVFYGGHVGLFCTDMMTWNTDSYASIYHAPRVYGDDIICDTRVTDNVLILLKMSGLVVNEQKSFTGGQLVRESCGVFAYNGFDVTPVLFRVKSFKRVLNSSSYCSLVEAINLFGDRKLPTLRAILINELQRSYRIEGLSKEESRLTNFTTNRNEFGIYTTNPHKYDCIRKHKSWVSFEKKNPPLTPDQKRFYREWQHEEKRVLKIVAVKGRPNVVASDPYYYDQWMRARIHVSSAEVNYSATRIRPQLTRIRPRWTPA